MSFIFNQKHPQKYSTLFVCYIINENETDKFKKEKCKIRLEKRVSEPIILVFKRQLIIFSIFFFIETNQVSMTDREKKKKPISRSQFRGTIFFIVAHFKFYSYVLWGYSPPPYPYCNNFISFLYAPQLLQYIIKTQCPSKMK